MTDEELEEMEEEETEEAVETTETAPKGKTEKLELDFDMDPVERLKKEIEFTDMEYMKLVGEHLLKEFASDANLKEDYRTRKVTLENVWKSIVEVAKKRQKNGSAVLSDDEVYGLAVHFVHDGKVAPTSKSTYTLTKEEKKSLEEKAREEYLAEQKEKLKKEEEKRLEKEKKEREKAAERERLAREKEKKEREESGQLSLFGDDFL